MKLANIILDDVSVQHCALNIKQHIECNYTKTFTILAYNAKYSIIFTYLSKNPSGIVLQYMCEDILLKCTVNDHHVNIMNPLINVNINFHYYPNLIGWIGGTYHNTRYCSVSFSSMKSPNTYCDHLVKTDTIAFFRYYLNKWYDIPFSFDEPAGINFYYDSTYQYVLARLQSQSLFETELLIFKTLYDVMSKN